MHRPVVGQIKTVTLRRDGEQWFVCFACLVEAVPLPFSDTVTGVDLGLRHFATLADGSTIENPRPLRRALKKLKKAQQHLSRCQKGKHRRARAKREVARLHRKVRNQRADFCHKAARQLVNSYGTVVFEDLKIRNIVQNHSLALSISDAGWGQFVQCCVVKAESAGRHILFVDPRYTSQKCSRCGRPQKLTLAERWYSCPECGLELDRDHNAALNISRLGWCAMSRTVVSLIQSEGTWRTVPGSMTYLARKLKGDRSMSLTRWSTDKRLGRGTARPARYDKSYTA